MPRPNHGSAVVDHKLMHFSASSLTLGDTEADGGCLRKFWYEKVEKRRGPETAAQRVGTALHANIEQYLRAGAVLVPLAARGRSMIPEPGPDLFIEHDLLIHPSVELAARAASTAQEAEEIRATATLAQPPLTLHDLPVIGFIDLWHARDPDGAIEVIDWKTTSNANYIKSPEAMARTVQMTLYGKWIMETLPGTQCVRLSHGYFVTRGAGGAHKVSLRVRPEQILTQWMRIEHIAGSLIDVVQEHDANKVPANLRACDAFGGCPHRGYCQAVTHDPDPLESFFGKAGAANMLRRMATMIPSKPTPLLGLVGKQQDNADALRAEILRVGRDEIETKYPGLPGLWDQLLDCKLGHPELTGELANAVGELQGTLGVDFIQGDGELGSYGPFNNPADLPNILHEAQTFLVPIAQPRAALAQVEDRVQLDLLPPDAPTSDPLPPTKSVDIEPARKTRGRPRKAKAAEDIVALPTTEMAPLETVAALAYTPAAVGGVYFYVNCAPSCKHESFWPFVHELIADLNKVADGAVDFRLVGNDHKFAYGRWKAAIAAALSQCDLPPGHYVLDGAGGEIALAVVEAMRAVTAVRGGVFVQ